MEYDAFFWSFFALGALTTAFAALAIIANRKRGRATSNTQLVALIFLAVANFSMSFMTGKLDHIDRMHREHLAQVSGLPASAFPGGKLPTTDLTAPDLDSSFKVKAPGGPTRRCVTNKSYSRLACMPVANVKDGVAAPWEIVTR